ncbi:GNAT family N-acetyltransferase [Chloroflexota bacterium]
MEVSNDLRVRPATSRDISQLDELISRGRFVHRHMDWRTPLEWIGNAPFLVLENGGSIVSVLACPPDPDTIGWVRVFCSDGSISVDKCWRYLWQKVKLDLSSNAIAKVAVISVGEWLQEILDKSELILHQDIIMMCWDTGELEYEQAEGDLNIRRMVPDDLYQVEQLDKLAFEPIWHNSLNALKKAFDQAAYASVVTEKDMLIAYQVSTQNLMGGHLARLAVHPGHQDQGLGSKMTVDLMTTLTRMGAQRITVNTQSDNPASLALYRKLGFKETGERYPVYLYEGAAPGD